MSRNHKVGSFENKKGLAVEVRGNIEAAIKVLGRKMKQEGVIKELKAKQYYEKPSEARCRRQAEAKSRWRKTLASKLD